MGARRFGDASRNIEERLGCKIGIESVGRRDRVLELVECLGHLYLKTRPTVVGTSGRILLAEQNRV